MPNFLTHNEQGYAATYGYTANTSNGVKEDYIFLTAAASVTDARDQEPQPQPRRSITD